MIYEVQTDKGGIIGYLSLIDSLDSRISEISLDDTEFDMLKETYENQGFFMFDPKNGVQKPHIIINMEFERSGFYGLVKGYIIKELRNRKIKDLL